MRQPPVHRKNSLAHAGQDIVSGDLGGAILHNEVSRESGLGPSIALLQLRVGNQA